MAKQKNNIGVIVIGIIVLAALFFILPKLNTSFVILPAGECNYNSAHNFLTNIQYSTETIDSYYTIADKNLGGWVAVDWNNDGQLESFGNPQMVEGDVATQCASKQQIATTVSGLLVVKYAESSYKTIAICPTEGGNFVVFYSNFETDAKLNISQCTNYVPPQPPINNNTVCITDVHQCSDGSYVGRNNSNNCAFDICPITSCTADVYSTCSNNITYKSKQCTNGTLHLIELTNPCTVTNSTANCTYTYSAWSTCSNSTMTQNRTYTVTPSICAGIPAATTQSCTPSTNFLMQEMFKLNGFSVKIWMVFLAIVAFIILLLLIK